MPAENWQKINRMLKPWLTVELTNTCNLSCVMCTVRKKDALPPMEMNRESFGRILEQIGEFSFQVEDLRLFWVGEPTCCTDFPLIIRDAGAFAESKPGLIPRIGFDTNASGLNDELRKAIIDASKSIPVHMTLSLDALTENVYNDIRRGGNFSVVMDNVLSLLDERGDEQNIHMMVQFVVMEQNVSQAEEFRAFWHKAFESRGRNCRDYLNASWAEGDGINWRPLTEQEDGSGDLQEKANALFSDTMRRLNLIDSVESVTVSSQGGGAHEVQ